VEGAWSVMIQQQHSLINGFLGQTGLTLDPQPP
jgi:hypothetical protein